MSINIPVDLIPQRHNTTDIRVPVHLVEKTKPTFGSMSELNAFEKQGLKEYFGGWSQLNELTESQQKMMMLIQSGANGELPDAMMPEYAKLYNYCIENNVFDVADITLLQRYGMEQFFLTRRVRAELDALGIEYHESLVTKDYFKDLRREVWGQLQPDPNETPLAEEISLQGTLEREYAVGGREGAELSLKNIFSGEQKVPYVSQHWLDTYAEIYAEVGAEPSLGRFFQMPETIERNISDVDDVPELAQGKEYRAFVDDEKDTWFSPAGSEEGEDWIDPDTEEFLLTFDDDIYIQPGDIEMGELMSKDDIMKGLEVKMAREKGELSLRKFFHEHPGLENEELLRRYQGVPEDKTMKDWFAENTARGSPPERYTKNVYKIWDEERVQARAYVSDLAMEAAPLNMPEGVDINDVVHFKNTIDFTDNLIPLPDNLTEGDLAFMGKLSGWMGSSKSLFVPLAEVFEYVGNYGISQLIGAPFFWVLMQMFPPGGQELISVGMGLAGMLMGDPLSMPIIAATLLNQEYSKQYHKRIQNDTAEQFYAWKWAFVRDGDQWFPAFSTTRTQSTSMYSAENEIEFSYGTDVYWSKDMDGELRPYFANLLGRKEFSDISDNNLTDSRLAGWGPMAKFNGLSDFFILRPDEQDNLIDYLTGKTDTLKISGPANNKFETFKDDAHYYNISNYVVQDQELPVYSDGSLPSHEKMLDLKYAFDFIKNFNLFGAPKDQKGITIGVVSTSQQLQEMAKWNHAHERTQWGVPPTDAEQYKSEVGNGDWWQDNREAGDLDDGWFLNSILIPQMETLWTVQRDAAYSHGFPRYSSWEYEGQTVSMGGVDPMYRQYMDTFELPYATSSSELHDQLDQIQNLTNRTKEEKAFLGQKSYTRYLLNYLNDRGGPNYLFNTLFDKTPEMFESEKGTAPGYLHDTNSVGRAYLSPWMNRGETILPQFMTGLNGDHRANITQWSQDLWDGYDQGLRDGEWPTVVLEDAKGPEPDKPKDPEPAKGPEKPDEQYYLDEVTGEHVLPGEQTPGTVWNEITKSWRSPEPETDQPADEPVNIATFEADDGDPEGFLQYLFPKPPTATEEDVPAITDQNLESFKNAMKILMNKGLLPEWLVSGEGKHKTLLIDDRLDAILASRRIMGDAQSLEKGEPGFKANSQLSRKTFEAVQRFIPKLSPNILGQSTVSFLEDVAQGEVHWIDQDMDKNGLLLMPETFVPDDLLEHRDEYEALIAKHRDNKNLMNQLLPVYSKLIEGDTLESIAYDDLDLAPDEYALNRLGKIMLWDDPSLAHHGYDRVVKFIDGHIARQMGIDTAPAIAVDPPTHIDEALKAIPIHTRTVDAPPPVIPILTSTSKHA